MSDDLSRRNFLRNTAATTAALAAARLALAVPSSTQSTIKPEAVPVPRPASTSPNAPLHVGVIGVAGKGQSNLQGVAEAGATIVALCDVDADRLRKASEAFPRAKTYTDFRKM